jgi:hypothetical protein
MSFSESVLVISLLHHVKLDSDFANILSVSERSFGIVRDVHFGILASSHEYFPLIIVIDD